MGERKKKSSQYSESGIYSFLYLKARWLYTFNIYISFSMEKRQSYKIGGRDVIWTLALPVILWSLFFLTSHFIFWKESHLWYKVESVEELNYWTLFFFQIKHYTLWLYVCHVRCSNPGICLKNHELLSIISGILVSY